MTNRWRFAWAWTIVATLLLAGCETLKKLEPYLPPPPPAPMPEPTPTPTPAPTPEPKKHEPVCVPPDLVTGCWHRPTDQGPDDGWLFIQAPVVPGGCVLSGESEIRTDGGPTLGLALNSAINDVIGGRCNVGGDCLIDDFSQRSFQAAVEQRLRDMDYCAGEDRPGNTDEISVAERGDTRFRQKFHVFVGDDGDEIPRTKGNRRTVNWAPNSFRGTWDHGAASAPQPPAGPAPAPPAPNPAPPKPTPAPPAPPAGGCNAKPCPRIVWTPESLPPGWNAELVGTPAWEFASAPYPKDSTDKDRDFTPKQRRNPTFCEAVGFNAPVIADCPLGKDGDPLRPERERYLLAGGFHREGRFPENDASCEPRSGAPSMIRNGTGNCRMCDSRRFDDPLHVCSDWF